MYQAEELMKSVNDALQAQAYVRRPASLYDPVKYVLAIGGKRIRPVLMMLGYQLFKDNPASIMSQALALETYHNFTLLHDDLMDRAEKRRGHPTLECQHGHSIGRHHAAHGLRANAALRCWASATGDGPLHRDGTGDWRRPAIRYGL